MALRLRQAIPGQPIPGCRQSTRVIVLDGLGYVVYPSSSTVVLLTPDLQLVETLELWPALPHRASSSRSGKVQGVCCSSVDGYIIAWSGAHIVLWKHNPQNGNARSKWAVHSTLVASSPVTTLDFQSGSLALGTVKGIESWRMDPTARVVVWDRLWERALPQPDSIQLSPGIGHLAWFKEEQSEKSAYILTLDKTGQPVGIAQEIRHPRQIAWIGWRRSTDGSDPVLYTVTTNSVFRIYSPVLDDPVWFQLLYSLDSQSFAPPSISITSSTSQKGKQPQELNRSGMMWVWDAETTRIAIRAELNKVAENKCSSATEAGLKILRSMGAEENDVIAWMGPDGSLVLRSIVNLNRKPPTLLKSLPLSRLFLPPGSTWPGCTLPIQMLHIPSSPHSLTVILPPTPSYPRITSIPISLIGLLSSKPGSITASSNSDPSDDLTYTQVENNILSFVRTPNGRGLLAIAEDGEINAWYKQQLNAAPDRWQNSSRALLGKGHWRVPVSPTKAAIFSKGRAILFYTNPPDAPATITLQHLDSGTYIPCEPVFLPHFSPQEDDPLELLLAVSDIDDGFEHKGRRTQRAVIVAATRSGEAWVWRASSKVDASGVSTSDPPDINFLSHYRLPLNEDVPKMILPVDPMGWHQSVIDWASDTPLQDMIVTISQDGDLEFWMPKLGQHLVGMDGSKINGHAIEHPDRACEVNGDGHRHTSKSGDADDEPWIRTGTVRTGRRNVINARCSSRKKTVLICELQDGRQEMTIWDSKVSEFSTGLELTQIYDSNEKIQDLDWTSTSDLQSVLAVGFAHRIILICEQRMSYVETTPGWAPFLTIDMNLYTSVPINDSIWLAGGSLAVGSGNQIYLFSRFLDMGEVEEQKGEEGMDDIFQLIAHQNGPLVDYHPVLLAQSLLWEKSPLVKNVIIGLAKALKECQEDGKKRLVFPRLDPAEFYSTQRTSVKAVKTGARKYDGLFEVVTTDIDDDKNDFSGNVVEELVELLHGPVQIPLSDAEKSFLATIAQVTLEADRQRRSLDISGMRYLMSIRTYVNWDRISSASGISTPSAGLLPQDGDSGGRGKGVNHFSFRNIVWATHSESQDLLLEAATQSCQNGKMMWEEAKRWGLFLWLKSAEVAKSQLEVIARNRYMADEDRDPINCSLIFFALGKKKVIHGLWRQAAGHKERNAMLKFLANDFTQERWKTAAMKNAYALLSKQRFEYAAAFFMLAGAAQDAINVCLRQLNDWQLGLAVARAVEGGTDGPMFKMIVRETVVPMAFQGGHRWLATWAFWMLGRRDMAVRILISPMTDVARDYSPDSPLEVGNSENDDPSLLLMFKHLKAKSLQTAKGTSEISTKLEFDFVLHNARVFFRMGCHNLALDLLRSWSFERPFFPARKRRMSSISTIPTPRSSSIFQPSGTSEPSASPTHHRRRPSFMLSNMNGRHHDSLVMDMDVLAESGASSRVASPAPIEVGEGSSETPALDVANIDAKENTSIPMAEVKEGKKHVMSPLPPSSEKKGGGNLMKELQQDVQQGGTEFNMDDFF